MEMLVAKQNYGFVGLNPWVRDRKFVYILLLNYSEHQSHNLKYYPGRRRLYLFCRK